MFFSNLLHTVRNIFVCNGSASSVALDILIADVCTFTAHKCGLRLWSLFPQDLHVDIVKVLLQDIEQWPIFMRAYFLGSFPDAVQKSPLLPSVLIKHFLYRLQSVQGAALLFKQSLSSFCLQWTFSVCVIPFPAACSVAKPPMPLFTLHRFLACLLSYRPATNRCILTIKLLARTSALCYTVHHWL